MNKHPDDDLDLINAKASAHFWMQKWFYENLEHKALKNILDEMKVEIKVCDIVKKMNEEMRKINQLIDQRIEELAVHSHDL